MNKNARRGIYGLGGIYLVYLAYELFKNLKTAGSEKPIMIIAMVFFAIIGAILVFQSALAMYKDSKKKMDEQKEYELSKLKKEDSEEDDDYQEYDDDLEDDELEEEDLEE